MLIYMVRHGQTEWNLQEKMQGRGDSPLTDLGREQAMQTAQLLESVEFDAAFCSPAGRAVTTAEIVLRGHGRTAEVEPAFAEIDLGTWEGTGYNQVDRKSREEREFFWKQPDKFTGEANNGETYEDVRLRVMSGLERVFANFAANATVLIVSHTISIRSVLNHFSGRGLADFWGGPVMDPGSASLLEYYSSADGSVLSYAGTPPIMINIPD